MGNVFVNHRSGLNLLEDRDEAAEAALEADRKAQELEAGTSGDPDSFDPGDHNVGDVLAFVDAHPEQSARVLAAEQDGKARVTILEALSD